MIYSIVKSSVTTQLPLQVTILTVYELIEMCRLWVWVILLFDFFFPFICRVFEIKFIIFTSKMKRFNSRIYFMWHVHRILILKFLRTYWLSFFSIYLFFVIEEWIYTNMNKRKQGRTLSGED